MLPALVSRIGATMDAVQAISQRLRPHVNRERLLRTATRLVARPSWTGDGGAAADELEEILDEDEFEVERPNAGFPTAPAVVVRVHGAAPGRTIQFDGHLDTVHLPFVEPSVEGDLLRGSGAADMKAGVAAAVEAVRALRDSGALTRGSVLLTAHDLHEAPWGDGRQLDAMIREGIVGDAVLLPEPLRNVLPVIGRGQSCWKATLRRPGPPVHEVMRPMDEPSVIAAGAELVAKLGQLDRALARESDPVAGRASVFIGQIHSGEIFNQYPQECWLEGTRRWLPGTSRADVERDFRALVQDVAKQTGVTLELQYQLVRDAFYLEQNHPFVANFQAAYSAISREKLPIGPKPFVDDGNCFWASAHVPAITHGPRAGGQHTVDEWVSIDDLVRVAHLYAVTAVLYCGESSAP
jgi:acetylornithine deacetylase/succinyl-diaminopimelate desuccinylase-like protein